MSTRETNSKRMGATLATTMLVLLLASPAMAQKTPETPIKGTIQVTEGADLQALARITMDQARAAALAEVPGATLSEGELEEEDGFLVYDIELTQEGQEIEVLIDAGDASVLEVERDD